MARFIRRTNQITKTMQDIRYFIADQLGLTRPVLMDEPDRDNADNESERPDLEEQNNPPYLGGEDEDERGNARGL